MLWPFRHVGNRNRANLTAFFDLRVVRGRRLHVSVWYTLLRRIHGQFRWFTVARFYRLAARGNLALFRLLRLTWRIIGARLSFSHGARSRFESGLFAIHVFTDLLSYFFASNSFTHFKPLFGERILKGKNQQSNTFCECLPHLQSTQQPPWLIGSSLPALQSPHSSYFL